MEKFPIEPVLDYLGQIIPGGRRSGKVKAKCSFHDDAVASAVIDYQHQRFRCFACGETGDAIELLMRHEGITFAIAVERAEELTGLAQSGVRKEQRSSGGLFDESGYSG
jgi:DNA primase